MRTLTLFPLLALLACAGDDAKDVDAPVDGDADTDTDSDADADADSDADADADGFTIEGTALDFAVQAPAAEGLCIELLDPSPALTGGEPELLIAETVGANGAVLFENVVTDSVLGLLMSAKDCGTENFTVFTSATGIPFEDIDGLGAGQTLSGVTAVVISMPFLAGMQLSAEAVGYTGDLETEGLLFGVVYDSAGVPLSGVTVTCGSCGPTYYLDADDYDGLFSTGASINTATDATAGAAFIIPGGPVGQYTADDGGAHTFPVQLNGSNPGAATITAFYAE